MVFFSENRLRVTSNIRIAEPRRYRVISVLDDYADLGGLGGRVAGLFFVNVLLGDIFGKFDWSTYVSSLVEKQPGL